MLVVASRVGVALSSRAMFRDHGLASAIGLVSFVLTTNFTFRFHHGRMALIKHKSLDSRTCK